MIFVRSFQYGMGVGKRIPKEDGLQDKVLRKGPCDTILVLSRFNKRPNIVLSGK